ncbi:MAG: hypothetical protein Q4C47_09980, partial [Planctomycetia bacterium]|nr:hypothetical protein [Planctomycetia bacterium]
MELPDVSGTVDHSDGDTTFTETVTPEVVEAVTPSDMTGDTGIRESVETGSTAETPADQIGPSTLPGTPDTFASTPVNTDPTSSSDSSVVRGTEKTDDKTSRRPADLPTKKSAKGKASVKKIPTGKRRDGTNVVWGDPNDDRMSLLTKILLWL